MKKLFLTLVCVIMIMANLVSVKALGLEELPQDETFTVIGITTDGYEVIDSADTYKKALAIYNRNLENWDNLAISSEGKVYKTNYGIIAIHSTDKCDYNVEFKNEQGGGSNYTNGCYGKDAAYIDTNDAGTQVLMRISGVNGWVNIDDVDIIPVEMITSRISVYSNIDNILYHQVKFSFDTDYFSSIINLGSCPDYLTNGEDYYSYDGHYFYTSDSLKAMLSDYRNGTFEHAVNVDNPYYNYYQFINHRSLTNVTIEQVNDYLYNTLNIVGPIYQYEDMDKDSADDALMRSQFYNNVDAFYQYQYEYGANAMMMLALSTNESATGRSSLSFTRNNLFGHAAYDTDVEKNASRYFNVRSSIYSHAKYYISGSYCNPQKFQFHGGFFGNKSNGMNVSYASDPYWGEKAAQNYAKLDEMFGYVDLNKYTLGIKTSDEEVEVYLYPESNANVLYTTDETSDYSFIILDSFSNENGDWYKIQADPTIDDDGDVDILYYYDYDNYVAYIHQSSVQVVVQGTGANKPLVDVTLDANGGVFENDEGVITYRMEEGNQVAFEEPVKDHALFIGWDNEDSIAAQGAYYTAQYQDVANIKMSMTPKTQYELNDRIDLLSGTIIVNFKDGTTQEVPITTSMVSGYDLTVAGNQEVMVTYAGCSVTYAISVSEELDARRAEIKAEIVSVIDELSDKEELSADDIQRLTVLKGRIDEYMLPYLNQTQLKQLDALMYKTVDHQVLYAVNKNDYDASITGLSTSIKWQDEFAHGMFEDYYVFNISNGINANDLEIATNVANGNGYDVMDSFTTSISENGNGFTDLHAPITVSISKPEGSTNSQVFTVFIIKDGEIRKCYTKQTDNYIQFMTNETGSYILAAKNTTNEYSSPDAYETVNLYNSDQDPSRIVKIIAIIAVAVIILIIALLLMRRKKRNDSKRNRL